MERWKYCSVILFSFYFFANGQLLWTDRFESFGSYLDRHSTPDHVSTAPRFTVLAPAVLRADSDENIVLQATGVSGAVPVYIQIWDFTKSSLLMDRSTSLDSSIGHQLLYNIRLPSVNLKPEEKKEKFVYLKVTFEGYYTDERVMLVSFHNGYIFIQTDKPIYNPGDTVRYRAFVSSPTFKAHEGTIMADIKNPDGIVVYQTNRMRAVKGIYKDTFTLTELVNEGTWTVTAKFDHWPQNTFNSTFEVKKYVLPAFNVTLTPRKPYFSIDDSELVVEITARYLFGQPVQGKAYVMFGVKHEKEMTRLRVIKQLTNLDGGTVSLSLDELKAEYPNIRSLVGKSVYIKASVLTQTGSDLVEAEKTGIRIVESLYVLSFRDAPKYFKPGLPLDLTLDVRYHDGSPVPNVRVQLKFLDTPLNIIGGTAHPIINMPKDQKTQVITAETVEAGLRPEQQARRVLRLLPYAPHGRPLNLLHISGVNRKVTVDESLSLLLTVVVEKPELRQHVKHITYMVMNKGRIVKAERVDVASQTVTTVQLEVTRDMMPSFRFVAFYSISWQQQGEEVVADSIFVDVEDSCVGKLSVGSVGTHSDLSPGRTLRLQVRGDPGAMVSLLAVDNAVFLLRRDRLTQAKIWDVVEQGDFGCTRGGGGGNAKGVFADAGLFFNSNSGFKTDVRQTLQCPQSTRMRRSAAQLERKATLERHYKDDLLQRCCLDGLRDIPMRYTCTRRSLYITEGVECIRAFRYCCGTYRDEPIDHNMPTTPAPFTTTSAPMYVEDDMIRLHVRERIPLRREMFDWDEPVLTYSRVYHGINKVHSEREGRVMLARPDGARGEAGDTYEDEWDEEELNEMQVDLRHKFFESWLWEDLPLPANVDHSGLASLTLERPLPDSITEWGILAVSASSQTGFCVAEPYNVKAWKPFFVDLRLPHSVARNDQIEIMAVVHNYGQYPMEARVTLMKTQDMCSVAFRDKHVQDISVAPGSSVGVPYTIVPMAVGKLPLEVMVVTRDMRFTDRIQKTLRVVLEGVQKTKVWSIVLNPSVEGGLQTVRMGKIELESVVPNSVPETFINVRGNVLADSLDNSMKEDSLAALIRMPGGCVEQNLASMVLPVIATLYLDRTNNWPSVGVQRKEEAFKYIQKGYNNQLAYRKSDGSYPPYSKQGASTWITAFVVKVFSMAHSIIGIDEQQVCEPLLYLLKNRFRNDLNIFTEENPVYSPTMTGGLRGDDPQTTLTAFVLIALAEAKQAGIQCQAEEGDIQDISQKAANYLKGALTVPRRPYTVAIASYALALVKNEFNFDPKRDLLAAAAPGGSHWADGENTLFSLEATGYALLALIKLGAMTEAAGPFKWLNSQRRQGGGFGSTQPTMVVLHALSEYMILQPPPPNLNLNVEVKMAGRTIPYNFNPDTSYSARSSRLPPGVDLEVLARGNGQGILEVVTYYNQLHEEDEKSPCEHFDLQVNIEESAEKPSPDVINSFQITIRVRALGPRDVRMVVLDVSLPTGFTPVNSDLELLSNSVDKYISNFKVVDNLSDRGSLILHMFKVSHKEPEILIFRLQQNFKVGHIQPSSVTVYEYYNPDHRCSRAYTPRESSEQLTQICRDNVCRCTQGDCCVPKKDSENFSNKYRETFACRTLHHVFKVKVLSVTESYYDKYELEITQVIKLGNEPGVLAGQTRLFMFHGGCRDSLKLIQNQHYLIMGPTHDLWTIDSTTNRFVYVLGRDSWVERWPSPQECTTNSSLREKCESLSAMATELSTNACQL